MPDKTLVFDLSTESPWLAREQLIKAAPELAKFVPKFASLETVYEAWTRNLLGLAKLPAKRNVRIERIVDDPEKMTVILNA